MKSSYIKFTIALIAFTSSLLFSYAKQPPANISSDAATYEENLLTKEQRDTLQVEMISLQRDIIAANRAIDEIPEVKAAKEEMYRLTKEKAPKSEIVAARARYNELRFAEQKKDPILVKKLERYEYIASLLEYDKLRNKVARARMPAEDVAAERPVVQMARPAYEVQVARELEEQKQGAEEALDEDITTSENELPHNVVKLFENNEVHIAGKIVQWDELATAFEELYKQEPELELQMDGEVETPVSKLMEMMRLAREAGFKDVSIRRLF